MSVQWKARHKSLSALFFIASLLFFSACQKACKGREGENVEGNQTGKQGEAAAIVNDVAINKLDVEKLHKRATERYAQAGRPLDTETSKKVRAGVLRKLIDDEIIRQQAKKDGINIDRFERVEALEKYKTKLGGEKGYKAFLERQGLSEKNIEDSVLDDLYREKLVDKAGSVPAPTDEEIKHHFQANQRLYTQPEMIHARHILLKVEPNDPKEKEQLVLKKAQEILKEASDPNVSFESLVNKYSEGPSAKQGGDLGFFPRGRMVKTFEDLAFSAPLKKAVGPVKTDFGYHIIYVEEKTPYKTSSLEDVRDRVVEFINRNKRARKSEELLANYRKTAAVKVTDFSLTQEEYASIAKGEVAKKEPKEEKKQEATN